MIRKLKVLLAMVTALVALVSLGASGAQGAEFHCDVAPCSFTLKTDGTGKTAHHVFVITNSASEAIATTCERLTGSGTSATKTSTTLTLTNLAYDGCKDSFGNAVTIDMNGCQYQLTSHGHLTIVNCNAGKVIEKTISTGCTATTGGVGVTLTGVSYHNVIVEGNEQITIEMKIPNWPVTLDGTKAQCGIDPSKTPIHGEYVTGNTLITGHTDPGGVMVNAWWA